MMNESSHITQRASSTERPKEPNVDIDADVPAADGFAVWDAQNAAQEAQWVELWNSWSAREVFSHPRYVKLFCHPGDQALCATWDGGEGKVLFPFILRDLSAEPYWEADLGPAYDLISPYGYGGAAFWDSPNPTRLASEFWKSFDAWAATRGLVAQFVRFSPFQDGLLAYPGEVCENRSVVLRDLRPPEHIIWGEFSRNICYNIRKAQRAGVQVKTDSRGDMLAEFLGIYDHTMRRREADPAYYFPRQFFERLQRDLPGQFIYFHALHGGRVLASELLLLSANSVYSYLGGTDSEAFRLSPNHLLKFEIIRWAAAQGKQWFVLGGGYEPDDGIFHYKRGFAPHGTVSFRVGWRVHDKKACDRLVDGRRRYQERVGQCWLPRPNFFPPYRA